MNTPRMNEAAGHARGIVNEAIFQEGCRLETELAASEKRSAEWEALFHKFGALVNERTTERDELKAKLEKCRASLEEVVAKPPCSDPDCCERAISCEGARKLAIVTLDQTK